MESTAQKNVVGIKTQRMNDKKREKYEGYTDREVECGRGEYEKGKQNRKNNKTTKNRKTGIKKKNKQENNIQYYFMFHRPGHDHFLKILLCFGYAGLKEPQTL
jgi:hypothetical protein